MTRSVLGRMTFLAAATLAVVACSDGYGYGGLAYNSDYDRYYGDPLGYSYVPYGYSAGNFGWWNGYYYPGNGSIIYDRRGRPRTWSQWHRRHWMSRDRYHDRDDRHRRRYRDPRY